MLSGADVISGELLHILSVFQHCQIINVTSLCNNVMNKVLAVALRLHYRADDGRHVRACMHVCVFMLFYMCVCVHCPR